MREMTVEMPFEIPRSKSAKAQFHYWLVAKSSELDLWGLEGRSVGVGFKWYTRTGFDNRKISLATRHIKRALKTAGILATSCDPYNLEQRIVYIRDGEGHGTLTLRED
jgi:hypothetical protein